MRHHDEPVDLLVAVIGEREHRPVVPGFAGAHLDAADDAVGAGCGGNLDAVAFGLLQLDGVGEIDGRRTSMRTLTASTARARSRHCHRDGCSA